jgi:hypothetical protein
MCSITAMCRGMLHECTDEGSALDQIVDMLEFLSAKTQ